MHQMRNYSTQDYSLANWLVFNGVELLGTVEYPGDTRKSFVFVSQPKLADYIEDWTEGHSETRDICKRFFQAHTIIKKALKESLSVDEV